MSAGIALGIMVLAFPGVIFFGGSIAAFNAAGVIDQTRQQAARSLYPQPEGRQFRFGYADLGASAWQMDPSIKFMANAIRGGQTPFWNPYSASGSVGPETLADAAFSPTSLLAATLGGSVTAITVSVLLTIFVGTWAVLELVRRRLTNDRLAGTSAGIFFVANGFATGYLASQVGLPFLLFPLLLLTSISVHVRPGWRAFAASTLAHLALALTTFIPTAVLVLAAAHLFAWTLASDERSAPSQAILRQGLPALAALGLGAFLWIPVLAHLVISSDLGTYAERVRPPSAAKSAWASALTPAHVWDVRWASLLPDGVRFTPYLGISTAMLWIAAAPRALRRAPLVLAWCLVIFGWSMHFGVAPVRPLASMPVLRSIRSEYWPVLSAAGGVLLTAHAVLTFRRGAASLHASFLGLALLGWLFAISLLDSEPQELVAARFIISMASLLGLGAMGLALWSRAQRAPASGLISVAVVGLVAIELVGLMNHTRPVRFEVDDPLPAYLQYITEHVGGDRVLNIGRRSLWPDWGSALGIRQAGTLTLGQFPWYRDLFTTRISDASSLFLTVEDASEALLEKPVLDALAIRYILVERGQNAGLDRLREDYLVVFQDDRTGVTVLENLDARPRVYLSPALNLTSDPLDVGTLTLAVTGDEDLWQQSRRAGVSEFAETETPGSSQVVRDEHATIVIEVESTSAAVLVVVDAFHPAWRAKINGEPVDIGMVNGAFRGIVVPAGSWTVVLTYRPLAITVGVSISVFVLLALLASAAAVSRLTSKNRPFLFELDRRAGSSSQ